MTDAELLNQAKLNLRIMTDGYDDELNALISAAKDDISEACDQDFDADNTNECKMVILYVRGLFGDGDEKAWNLYKERLAVIGTRRMVENDA